MGWFSKAKKKAKRYGTALATGGLSEVVGSLDGSDAADAAKKAARQQVAGMQAADAQFREDMNPFRNMLTPEQMQAGINLATDSQTQMDYLQNNPMFNNLMERSKQDIFGNLAAKGKLGSGSTQEALQQSYLATGNDLINQQINRFNPLLSNMQNAAARTGANSSAMLSGIGEAQSAGTMGAANARSQGMNNLIGLGMTGAGMFMGGPAEAALTGGSMQPQSQWSFSDPSSGYNF